MYAGGDFARVGPQPQCHLAGLGDLTTGTLLVRFDAESESTGVLLRWQFANGLSALAVAVERAGHERGPWTPLALQPHDEGEVTVALDPTAVAGHAYWYRLVVTLPGGASQAFGPIQAILPGAITTSGLTRLAPNPASGRVNIEYAVAQGEPVRLSLLDVAGRELEVLVAGDAAPGRYTLAWDARHARVPWASGVYFLRWESPGLRTTRRLILAR